MDYLKDLNELALGSRLKRLSDTIMREVTILYQKSGIDFEPSLMPVFNYLSNNKEAGITQIATSLSISQPAVSQFISTLTKKGYVKLSIDKIDTRKRNLQLTNKGRSLLIQLKPIWEVIAAEVKVMVIESEPNLLDALNKFETNFIKMNFNERVLNKINPEGSEVVKIAEYRDKYKDAIRRLNYEWLEKYFTVEPIDVRSLSNPQKEIIDKGGYVCFAVMGEEVAGTASLLKVKNNVYELGKMAVTEKYQGKKIGQKLMEHCIEKARGLKSKKVILYSNSKLAAAINLYFKNGFRVIPMEESVPYKRSNIKMELLLN